MYGKIAGMTNFRNRINFNKRIKEGKLKLGFLSNLTKSLN